MPEEVYGLANMRPRMISLWKIICFGILLLLSGCGRMEETEELAVPAYLVRITAGTVNGSGVLYSIEGDTLFIMTAAHMAEHASEAGGFVTLTFCDGWEAASSDILVSELADLAMVRLSMENVDPERRELYQCVRIDKESFDLLRTKDTCEAVGCIGEKKAIRSEGCILDPWIYMEDYGQYMIWADVKIQPGMSGGGLFDKEGHLIGILSGASEDGELAAVPLSLVLQFLISTGADMH